MVYHIAFIIYMKDFNRFKPNINVMIKKLCTAQFVIQTYSKRQQCKMFKISNPMKNNNEFTVEISFYFLKFNFLHYINLRENEVLKVIMLKILEI